jgi:hypothetical protein
MRIKPTTWVIALLLLLLVASVGFDAHGALLAQFSKPTAGAAAMPGMQSMAGPIDPSAPNAAAKCPMMQGGHKLAAGPDAPSQKACGGSCSMDKAGSGACSMDKAGQGTCPMAKPAAKADSAAAGPAATATDQPAAATYICPMCPDVKSDKPGRCPKCGMDLVKKK